MMDESQSERTPLISRQYTTGRTDSVDKFSPSQKRKFACICILLAEGLERLAFYSLFGNLVYFLTTGPLCWQTSLASAAQLVSIGLVYAVGFLAGWLSDSQFGRYFTIILGYSFYIIGYVILPVIGYYVPTLPMGQNFSLHEGTQCNNTLTSSIPLCYESSNYSCSTVLFTCLSVVSLGAGIVRTNLAPFGGDQIRDEGLEATTKFFSYFYWAINVGSLIAYTAVVFLQQFAGFFAGYLVPCICIMLSFVIFLAGSPVYYKYNIKIKVFSTIIDIYKNALNVRARSRVTRPNYCQQLSHFVDFAKVNHGGQYEDKQVEDLKNLWKAIKVFIMLIPYWICYSQMSGNLFLLQGLHLRLDYDKNSNTSCSSRNNLDEPWSICNNITFNNPNSIDQHDLKDPTVPAATLTLFNVLFIIITLPLVQKLYKALTIRGVNVLTWKRIAFGMFLASLSLLAGGILEHFRLMNMLDCGFYYQRIGNTIYEAAPGVSIWWQVIQYSFMGASEVFTIVTGIEYAYMMAPQALQGIIMGLFWLSAGCGDFLAISLPYIFRNNIWKNPMFINCNRIDYYFFILAGFLFIYTIVFASVAVCSDLGLNRQAVEREIIASRILTPKNSRRRVNASMQASSSTSSKELHGESSSTT